MSAWQMMNLHPQAQARRIAREANNDGGSGGAGDGVEIPDLPPSLPQSLKDISGLPDYAQGLYEKGSDGSFSYKGLGPIRSALERERTAARAAKAELGDLAGFRDLGKTPDEIREMLKEPDAADKDSAGGDAIEKARATVAKQNERAIKAKDEMISLKDQEITRLREQLHRHMVAAEATAQISAADGAPRLLMPHIERYAKVVDEGGGNIAVHIVDDDGERRYGADGQAMTIQTLVREMRDDEVFSMAFRASGSGGGGASTRQGSGGAKTIKRTAFDALSPTERAARMSEGFTVV